MIDIFHNFIKFRVERRFMNKDNSIANLPPVRLSERFANSEKFNDLFQYGMDLVEETANFLDREGRQQATKLPQSVKTLYGTEAIRLTTRLMQIASWLLLQRAIVDGEMNKQQALKEKNNIKLTQLASRTKSTYWRDLPQSFIDLIERSLSLQKRLCQLDKELYGKTFKITQNENPVATQHDLLQTAFNKKFSNN